MAQARLAEAEAALKKAEQSKAREVAAAQLALDQASLVLARIEERRNREPAGPQRRDPRGARPVRGQPHARPRPRSRPTRPTSSRPAPTTRPTSSRPRPTSRRPGPTSGTPRSTSAIAGSSPRSTAGSRGRLFDVGNLVGDGQATVLATILQGRPDLRLRQRQRERPAPVPPDGPRGDARGLREGGRDRRSTSAWPTRRASRTRASSTTPTPSVDPASGTVLARGVFDNPDRVIVPGLFVRVRVALEEQARRPARPRGGARDRPGGPFLLVVGRRTNVVEQRAVKVGVAGGRPAGDRRRTSSPTTW